MPATNTMSNGGVIPRALSSKQERKLMDYLDERLLQLTRNFKKRSEESSTLQTLSAYLEESRRILALILQIPPIDPSTSLRIAYLLRLTGDTLGSIPGYKVGNGNDARDTLQDLADFLDDLDQAWVAILKGQVWDPKTAAGVDLVLPAEANSSSHQLKSSPPSQTDLTRLRSLMVSSEGALEEWMANARGDGDHVAEEPEDVSAMLERMGLLEEYDSLFARTFSLLGPLGNSELLDTMSRQES